ncbi:MAG: hypothetical protein HY974_03475 [Candidatus Kerfeldbacteria bacterium]|nr:hypothetical protein [Candidatus Kerfeldbacteria bacterium]
MLTSQDIQTLIQAEREVFATKEDIGGLRQSVDALTTSVDAYAKKADTYHQEMTVLIYKVQRMEDWIRQASDKVGIRYAQ